MAEDPQSPQSKSGKARKPRVCSLPGCDNPGILVCPTCQEQRREKFWVCCQEHLVECWPTHSPIHLEPVPVRHKKQRSEQPSISQGNPTPPASSSASSSEAGQASPAAAASSSAAPAAESVEQPAAAELKVEPAQPQPQPVVAAAAAAVVAEEQKETPRPPAAAASTAVPSAERPVEQWNGREGNCRWRFVDQKWGPQKPTNPGFLSITADGQMTIYEKHDKKKTLQTYPIRNSIVCVIQRLVPTEFMFRFQPDALSGKINPIVFHPTHKDLRVEWCESFRRAGAAICRPIHEGVAEVPKKANKKANFKPHYCILYADHIDFLKDKADPTIKDDLLIPLTGVTVQSEDDPKLAQKGQFGWSLLHNGEPLLFMQADSARARQQWVDAFNGRLDPKYRFTMQPNEDIATAYEKWLDPMADAGALLLEAAVRPAAADAFGPQGGAADSGSAAAVSSASGGKPKKPLEQLDPVSVDNKCQRTLCQNDRVLVCPSCQDLGLPKFWVCSQECLQKCWKVHKAVHKAPAPAPAPAPAAAAAPSAAQPDAAAVEEAKPQEAAPAPAAEAVAQAPVAEQAAPAPSAEAVAQAPVAEQAAPIAEVVAQE